MKYDYSSNNISYYPTKLYSKIRYLPPRSGERYASALTNMAYNNKVRRYYGKINLKDYI